MQALTKIIQLLGLVLIFNGIAAADTEPRVVVSLSPMHSLVSALMRGVAEPVLLYDRGVRDGIELDPFQKAQVITADMLIWTGPGLETGLARTVDQTPLLQYKLLTLSNYVPLLPRAVYQGDGADRQSAYDLAFWNDPRLAIMAVRMITPRLVRLDPAHQEVYLDNEIALIKRLKGLEKEVAAMLAPYDGLSADVRAGLDQYFMHRYLAADGFADHRNGRAQKVSTASAATCLPIDIDSQILTPGPDYYFKSMRQTTDAVIACIQRSNSKKSHATSSGKTTYGES
jgi:zinc transport system substrate-binding protein